MKYAFLASLLLLGACGQAVVQAEMDSAQPSAEAGRSWEVSQFYSPIIGYVEIIKDKRTNCEYVLTDEGPFLRQGSCNANVTVTPEVSTSVFQ